MPISYVLFHTQSDVIIFRISILRMFTFVRHLNILCLRNKLLTLGGKLFQAQALLHAK